MQTACYAIGTEQAGHESDDDSTFALVYASTNPCRMHEEDVEARPDMETWMSGLRQGTSTSERF